jgi:hypothetical protein
MGRVAGCGVAIRGAQAGSWVDPVINRTTTAPPGSPSAGDRYIIAAVATGDWAGKEDQIAEWNGASWDYTVPYIGLTVYVEAETEYVSWNGTAWVIESLSPHASTHADGGSDEVTPLSIGADVLNGFVNRTDSTLGMSGSDFQITTAGSYDIWSNGNKFTKSTTQSVTITDDQALTFVYFDTSGVIQKSTSMWDLKSDNVPIATVYKDGSNYIITDERHGFRRDRDWHEWAHDTIGARYESGFTGTFGNTSLSLTQGRVHDEDIDYDSGATKTDCQLWYRNAGVTSMRLELGKTVPYKDTVGDGSGILQYDNAGTLTNVTVNRYINSWVYATNSPAYPIVVVVGQGEHVTLTGAQNEALPSILLPTAEWKLLYRATYRNVGGVATYIAAEDCRTTSTGPAGSPANTDHAGLTGRDAANQHPIEAINTTETDTNKVLQPDGAGAMQFNTAEIDNAVATDGDTAPTKTVMTGGKLDADLPDEELDGDVGAILLDLRRRLVPRGSNLNGYSQFVNDSNPALRRKFEHEFETLTAPGQTNEVNVENWKNIIVALTFASLDTNAVVEIQGSMDASAGSWFPIAAYDNSITGWAVSGAQGTITVADATHALHLKPVSANWIRVNFVSESGGTAVTIAAVAKCGVSN